MSSERKQTKLREFDDLGEKEQFMVDCFASYWSPARVSKGILERYGQEEELKPKAILAFKLRNEKLILKRRKEIGDEVPIINPTARYKMAQEVYDMAMEGVDKFFGGKIYKSLDPKTAILAVKLAHEMSGTKDNGVVADDDIIRKVVQEAFDRIKADNPKMADTDIVNILMNELDENAKPYVEELSSDLIN